MGLLPERPLVKSNVDRSRSPIIVPFAILGVLSLLGLCAALFALRHGGVETAGGTGDAVPVVTSPAPTTFVPTGPYGVGETTLHLASNGAPVEVWYPADADTTHGSEATINLKDYLPPAVLALVKDFPDVIQKTGGIRGLIVAQGRFPLVVFSHGYGGFRTQSSFLTAHLASWGFVVAAPDHLSRDITAVLNQAFAGGGSTEDLSSNADVVDLESTISLMGSQDATSTSPFYRHLDMSRIAAVGHSAGGSAAEKLAVADPQVKAFVGLAGASFGSFGQTPSGYGSKAPQQPGLLMFGDADTVVTPGTVKNAYNDLNQPKRLIRLVGSGHLVFSDICTIDSSAGGLVGAAERAGLPIPASLAQLGTDGCSASDIPVTRVWPAIDQSVTAELRWALGYDQGQGALEGLTDAFPGVVGTNTTADSVSGATTGG
jgi:predicted dienelactone hydrolase